MPKDTARCSVGDLISELSSLMEQCIQQVDIVESSVIDWVETDGQIASFPLVDFQRMDFVRQLQIDIVATLNALVKLTPDVVLSTDACCAILQGAKLEFTRRHLEKCLDIDPNAHVAPATLTTEFEHF